jgi:hypothetical protein
VSQGSEGDDGSLAVPSLEPRHHGGRAHAHDHGCIVSLSSQTVTGLRRALAFCSLEGHEHYVTAVVILGDPESERGGPMSAPGFRLATASNDGSVQVRAAKGLSEGGVGGHHLTRTYRLWSTRAALVCVVT